jgi:hypothetical protein
MVNMDSILYRRCSFIFVLGVAGYNNQDLRSIGCDTLGLTSELMLMIAKTGIIFYALSSPV